MPSSRLLARQLGNVKFYGGIFIPCQPVIEVINLKRKSKGLANARGQLA